MAETVVIPWYATGFRADAFADALDKVAAASLRYGAISYAVYRYNDDRYKFQQFVTFADHLDWERYWEGPDMVDFRTRCSGWFQVPVLYGTWERTAFGAIEEPEELAERTAAGTRTNGHGNGAVVDDVA
jgi:hypothetical protein